MKTKAVRLYGKRDMRLETFELPPIQADELLVKIISDSVCMSTYKLSELGLDHKRAPEDLPDNPIIVGHEFCGEIIEVGQKWKDRYKPGQKFAIQPNLNMTTNMHSLGFSYPFCGGNSQYAIVPAKAMEIDAVLEYDQDVYYPGSLAEPMSCCIAAFHAQYHTTPGSYEHIMGCKEGGKLALLGGVGPMGLGSIDIALHTVKPKVLVVTDINKERLKRAAEIYSPEYAKTLGIQLAYVNTMENGAEEAIMAMTEGQGYQDVFVFAPVAAVVEQADRLLATDGCLNFFAGPTDQTFSAKFNFYNVHYATTHLAGTSGGNTDDMRESIQMMNRGIWNPSPMVTHIGGLDAVVDTVLNLPKIPGGKKLIYNHISMPLTAIEDFAELGKEDPLFAELDRLVGLNQGLWSGEAEHYLLEHARSIKG